MKIIILFVGVAGLMESLCTYYTNHHNKTKIMYCPHPVPVRQHHHHAVS